MSHNFFKYAKIFTTNRNIKFEPMFCLFTIPHFFYVFLTQKEENIIITHKYKFVVNGFTNFMIINDKGQHFNVNNSLWFWKWDSIEDWHNLKVGDNINSNYYGIRIPFLSCFPNIVNTNYSSNTIQDNNEDKIEKNIDSSLLTNKDSYENKKYSSKIISGLVVSCK